MKALARPLPWQPLLPGALLCTVIALAALLLAQQVGGPPVLHALWLGLGLHAVGRGEPVDAGVRWCAGPLLRAGVALMGLRIGLEPVAALGAPAAGAVLLAVASTLALGLAGARLLRLGWRAGVLTGGASAICGASAALAIAAALPRDGGRDGERFVLWVVVGVSLWSTGAMLLYPLLAQQLGLQAAGAGLFLGGSIHDVAQVVGAATLLGPAALDAAVVTKTLRIALLVVVVAGVAWAVGGGGRARLPGYLVAFVVLALAGHLLALPPALKQAAGWVSAGCMVLAIAALGLRTSVRELLALGWRPLALLAAEALWIAGLMLGAALWLQWSPR